MRALVAALALGVAAAACGGDVYTVDVRLAPGLICDRQIADLASVGVEVVRETADGLEQMTELDQCVALPAGVNRARELVGVLQETGITVEEVPAETRTILRFVGYARPSCARGGWERLCGITCPPVRLDEIPAEGVTANFVCDGILPEVDRVYNGCLNLEILTADQRSRICSQGE